MLERNPNAETFLALARELSESRERFPFPGLDDASCKLLKAEQVGLPSKYVLDIDAFVQELNSAGMRIVLERGCVYVCVHSDNFDFGPDTVRYFFPRHLNPEAISDPKLKQFVELSKIHPLI
jgi:hypothetical protein